ncbi:phage protease [Pseudomonas aeruginosa]|nr:phage protease [Pseudomonas aeruginosa]
MPNLIALNTDLSASLADDQTEAPDWIELIPAGPNVQGRDGRRWLFDAAAQQLVRNAFAQRDIDLPIDWGTRHPAPRPQGRRGSGGGLDQAAGGSRRRLAVGPRPVDPSR